MSSHRPLGSPTARQRREWMTERSDHCSAPANHREEQANGGEKEKRGEEDVDFNRRRSIPAAVPWPPELCKKNLKVSRKTSRRTSRVWRKQSVTIGRGGGAGIFFFLYESSKRKTEVFRTAKSGRCVSSLHPPLGGVSPDHISPRLQLMVFTPFSGNTCKIAVGRNFRKITFILKGKKKIRKRSRRSTEDDVDNRYRN